jgi:hypothetical protein
VKIKREKEKKFRDLENDNWPGDLELEVKNIGDKPIYFLWFVIEIPEAKVNGSHQVFSIVYGRFELADLNNRPNADDLPIRPGETKVLAIEEMSIRGWPEQIARGFVTARIHGVRLQFQNMSFGDGTGFFGGTGAPRPKPNGEPNSTACVPPADRYGGSALARVIGDGINDLEGVKNSTYAGIFRPALFFAKESIGALTPRALKSASAPLECNCINGSCWYGTVRQINRMRRTSFAISAAPSRTFRQLSALSLGIVSFGT